MASDLFLQGLEIVWINILLSGDNAVVIAMACRALPRRERRWGIALGAAAAVALRIVFTIVVVELLAVPFIRLVAGILLLMIAVKLLVDARATKTIASSPTIWGAVRTIAVADAVMSLDNVFAIAAAAHESELLILFGLAFSIPLVIFGSTLVVAMLNRFPILVWAGAAMLGWVAGELIAADLHVSVWLWRAGVLTLRPWLAPAGAVLVIFCAGLARALIRPRVALRP